MRILLIAPASGMWRGVGKHRLFNGRTFRFSLLSLLSLAAETPRDCSVRIIDEQIEDIPWDEEFDLVGITCMTAIAPRAYDIADAFRARNTPVVLGGMHPSFLPDEALKHADAVVIGEAEGVWPGVVKDAASGRMSGIYQAPRPPDLSQLKPLPRELLKGRAYATVQAVQATRGCGHHCNFCSVSAFHQGVQRRRPVEQVLDEIARLPQRFFIFVDDNLTEDREYAERLFKGLVPLQKRWMTQSTLAIAEDLALVDLAAEAGCYGFFAGLETFSESNLEAAGKSFNRVDFYREAVALLHSRGIGVEAGIVFGFEGDRPDVFQRTLHLLDDLKIDLIQVSIFTPLPGTPRFEAMRDRISDLNWTHYDFHHAVFQPRGMSAETLQAGHDWVTREFYRPWRIARRLAWRARWPKGLETLPYATAMNMAYYGRVLRRGHRARHSAAEYLAKWRGGGMSPSVFEHFAKRSHQL